MPPTLLNRIHLKQHSRRVVIALVTAVLTVALTASCSSEPTAQAEPPEANPILLAEPAPPTTTTTVAEPALPPLPVPELLPLEPYTTDEIPTVGRLSIPAIGLDQPLQVGMTLSAINLGPSIWPGTAAPGQLGNLVIAGHRTTYSRPFFDLDLVEEGTEMNIETADGETFTYVATGTQIVNEDEVWIADQTYGYTATTFACHPKGSSRQRIVVFWQLLDQEGNPVPALDAS